MWLPSDDENTEYLRHTTPIPAARDTIYGTPARWYRIHVDYIPALLGLCDYYVHLDAHEGSAEEKAAGVQRWLELQNYLLSGEAMDAEGDGVTDQDICDIVRSCIETGNVDDVMRDRYNLLPPPTGESGDLVEVPGATTPVIDTCDRDAIYAAVKQMVDWLDELIGQMLDLMSSATNWVEFLGHLVSSFPILGQMPFDEVFEYMGEWLEDLSTGYNASYNQDIRERYYCGLFCLAVETCSINPKQMADFFRTELSLWSQQSDWYDLLVAIASLGTTGDYVVHIMYFLAMTSFSFGVTWAGIEPSQFKNIVLALTNDSDPDWAILCDACQPHSLCHFHFASSQYDWIPSPLNLGSWETDIGLTCYGHPDTSVGGVQYEWHLGDAYNVSKISIDCILKGGATTSVPRPVRITALTDQGVKENEVWIKCNYGTVKEVTIELFDCPDCRIIEIEARVGSTGGGSYVKVTDVRVWLEEQCEPAWSTFCSEIE